MPKKSSRTNQRHPRRRSELGCQFVQPIFYLMWVLKFALWHYVFSGLSHSSFSLNNKRHIPFVGVLWLCWHFRAAIIFRILSNTINDVTGWPQLKPQRLSIKRVDRNSRKQTRNQRVDVFRDRTVMQKAIPLDGQCRLGYASTGTIHGISAHQFRNGRQEHS